jgi:hypothetical protein
MSVATLMVWLPRGEGPRYSEVVSRSIDPRQQAIAEEWDARGRPDCMHDDYERHRIQGVDQGDYMCTNCGAEWWRNGPRPSPQDAAIFL